MICPNCASVGFCHPFYEVRNVPTNSCLLVEDRREALDFPTGDIALAVCQRCGFVFNQAWDPERTIYSDRYEETQGFSPTFNKFHLSLAEELIDTYDIRGKTVVEIGCGKGEFLALVCRLGGNCGIGYDPAFVPARQRSDENIRFVREFFTEKTTAEPADFFCCKMTLEHIGQTQAFVKAVRAATKRTDSVVFFQVPDVARILKEKAFWDIYYEHCSYFSSGSLKHLFTQTGFEVDRIWTGYQSQYLMIVAKPAGNRSDPGRANDGADVAEIVRLCDGFAATTAYHRMAWTNRLSSWAASGRRTVLWGSGSKAVAFLTTLGVRDEIEYAVDINPYRAGKFLPCTGQSIVAPPFLRDYRPDNVVIMNPVYLREVEHELARQRCEPRIYTILDLEAEGK